VIYFQKLDPRAAATVVEPHKLALGAFSPDREGRTRSVLVPPKGGKFVSTKIRIVGQLIDPYITTPQDLLQEYVHAAGYYVEPDGELSIYLVSTYHDAIYLRHGQAVAILSLGTEEWEEANGTPAAEHPPVVRS